MSQQLRHPQVARSSYRRAYLSLWIVMGIGIVAVGVLSRSLAAAPSPLTGVIFAVSALVLIISFTLAARVTIALERAHRRSRSVERTSVFRWPSRAKSPASAGRRNKNT